MKIFRMLAIVIFMLSATASVNAGVAVLAPKSFIEQLPPPPPRPPLPHVEIRDRRPVHHRVYRRRPLIRLPHIKLPPHPRRPPPFHL